MGDLDSSTTGAESKAFFFFGGGGRGSRPTTGIKKKLVEKNKVKYINNMHKIFSYMFRHSMGAIFRESSQ
jgi:hypothetical protein